MIHTTSLSYDIQNAYYSAVLNIFRSVADMSGCRDRRASSRAVILVYQSSQVKYSIGNDDKFNHANLILLLFDSTNTNVCPSVFCLCSSLTTIVSLSLLEPTPSQLSTEPIVAEVTSIFTAVGLYPTSADSCSCNAASPAPPSLTIMNCDHSSSSTISSPTTSSAIQKPSSSSTSKVIETWTISYLTQSTTTTAAVCLEGTSKISSLTPSQTCGPPSSSLTASANCEELSVITLIFFNSAKLT